MIFQLQEAKNSVFDTTGQVAALQRELDNKENNYRLLEARFNKDKEESIKLTAKIENMQDRHVPEFVSIILKVFTKSCSRY